MCMHCFSSDDTEYRMIALAGSIRHGRLRSLHTGGRAGLRPYHLQEAASRLLYKAHPIGGIILPVPPLVTLYRSKMRLLISSLSLLAALSAFAAPADSTLEKRQIQTISPEEIAAFKPYSFYAASAYCDPSVLKTWTCGGARRGSYHI